MRSLVASVHKLGHYLPSPSLCCDTLKKTNVPSLCSIFPLPLFSPPFPSAIHSARGETKRGRKKPSLTRSFDDSRLVRLGGIAVAPAVRESLHHGGKQSAAPTRPIRSSDRRHVLETRAPQNNSKRASSSSLPTQGNGNCLLPRAAVMTLVDPFALDPTV